MRRLVAAWILLAVGTALVVAIRCGRSPPPAPAPSLPKFVVPELKGRRNTAAERHAAALRERFAKLGLRAAWSGPETSPSSEPALFGHPEGFPKAWLAPDERPTSWEPDEP